MEKEFIGILMVIIMKENLNLILDLEKKVLYKVYMKENLDLIKGTEKEK